MLLKSAETLMEGSELSSCVRMVVRANSFIAITVCRGRPEFNDDSISLDEMQRNVLFELCHFLQII
jgi:hypothetical protein